MPNNVGENIKKRRKELNYSQKKVAEYLGISQQAYSKYENNLNSFNFETALKLGEILEISLDDLGLDYRSSSENYTAPDYSNIKGIMPLPEMKKIPLLGAIACGEPIYKEENEWISLPTDIKADFCLRCEGDSMINARINDGDIVFIRACPEVDNGQIAAISINNEVTLKRVYYYPEKNKLVLNPENPKYEPFVYTNEELNEVRILGKAVMFLSTVR